MAPSQQLFSTPLTRLFNIRHPVMLAGELVSLNASNRSSLFNFNRHECGCRPETCCRCYQCWCVDLPYSWLGYKHSYAGGIGVIGGINYSPKMLREGIDDLTSKLEDKDAPFGIDLAIPQIG